MVFEVGNSSSSAPNDEETPEEPPQQPSNQVTNLKFNNLGQPIGPGSAKPSSELGRLTRSQISVIHEDWKKVPSSGKDNLWDDIKNKFRLKDTQKEQYLQRAGEAWKRRKFAVRKRLDPKKSFVDWVAARPASVTPEDWYIFCQNERKEEQLAARERNRAIRMNAPRKTTHNTGRDGYARAAEKFREKHGRNPSRVELWLETHKMKNGSYAPHDEEIAQKFQAFLEMMQGQQVVDNLVGEPFLGAFGEKSTKKRVHCVGSTISRKSLMSSAFAREMLEEVESENELWSTKFASLEASNETLVSRFDELIESLRNGKYDSSKNHHHAPNPLTHQPSSSHLPEPTDCAILNWSRKVVAQGLRYPSGSVRVVHGHELESREVKVLLDRVLDPNCRVYGDVQGGCETLEDVGAGGFIYWHEDFLV